MSRRLLGAFLRCSATGPIRHRVDHCDRIESTVVVGPGSGDLIGGRAKVSLGRHFLEAGFVVLPSRPLGSERDVFEEQVEDEHSCSLPPGVEEDGAEHCLEGIREDRFLFPAAGLVFALAQQQLWADADPPTDFSERGGVHNRSSQLRELTLGKVGVVVVDVIGDGEPEHCIAEKLEALIRLGFIRFGAEAPVREREAKQGRFNKLVAELVDQFRDVGCLVQDSAPTCPNT